MESDVLKKAMGIDGEAAAAGAGWCLFVGCGIVVVVNCAIDVDGRSWMLESMVVTQSFCFAWGSYGNNHNCNHVVGFGDDGDHSKKIVSWQNGRRVVFNTILIINIFDTL
jgi:hypothetical protein